MSPEDLALLRRLEPNPASFEASGLAEVATCGPFVLYRPPDGAGWGPEAAPREQDVSESDIADLRRAFVGIGKPLQIELVDQLYPRFPAVLVWAGLAEVERESLLVCGPDVLRPVAAPGVVVRFLGPEDDDETLVTFQQIHADARERTPRKIAGLRADILRSNGKCAALAWLDGEQVGTGFISCVDGIGEITRIATLEHVRRRGVAATLTTFLLESAFADGATLAWLTASGPPAQALYEKLGFRHIGEKLKFVEPAVR